MEYVLAEKKALRKVIISKRDALSDRERQEASARICSELEKNELFADAEKILLFASFGSEIPTDNIFVLCKRLGKTVFYPKVNGKEMIFYRVDSLSDLTGGFRGIREPAADAGEFIPSENCSKDLMIMPGTAFDREGSRLGYGGGFYDRYLAKLPEMKEKTIAIGYKMQETEHIPADEHDIKPGKIILV